MFRDRIYSFFLTIFLSGLLASAVTAQDFPDRPVPPRLVNDFAGMLKADEVNSLEQNLVAFNDSTSTQISIVTVPSLMGYDRADYAQRLGEKWGIGQKQLNNGVLILVKPKQPESAGQVFIAQGYGLEGVLPDITCAQIVDNDILPAFRRDDYYGGLSKAVNTIMAITRGEYTAADYAKKVGKKSGGGFPLGTIIVIVIIILIISRGSGGGGSRHIGSGNMPLWMLLSMMNSGRGSHGGSWGGFSGGGGGGFGGFGGGSFGGGGAGGSW
jgi:uncharacterized protein